MFFFPGYCLDLLYKNYLNNVFKSTCSDEHDIVLPVLCFHPVHHQLGELVVHICPNHDGAPPNGVHWIVHGRVAPGEGDHIIRKIFGGVEASKCLAGALKLKVKVKFYNRYFICKCDFTVWFKYKDSQFQAEDRAPSPGKAPTDSWVHLCGRRGPGKPS